MSELSPLRATGVPSLFCEGNPRGCHSHLRAKTIEALRRAAYAAGVPVFVERRFRMLDRTRLYWLSLLCLPPGCFISQGGNLGGGGTLNQGDIVEVAGRLWE